MTHVTIDGQSIEAPAGTTVLQAARQAGIEIPTLCDHPALKPYGGCRLCVVEVEGLRTLQASCTLPVFKDMVVHTASPKVCKSRQFVLSLLFSERNHFCMYCQKSGGDCELQNAAYGEGMDHWPYQPGWKPFLVDASSPYFVIDHNRCILCRRCIRACSELVGNYTLNIENRGARNLLVADCGLPVGDSSCVNCGACVQVCPTGALIDRQSAYLGQDAKLAHTRSICVGCSLGCGVDLLTRDNHLVRVDGDWEAPVNQGVLCELGRYRSRELDGRSRIETPLVRKDGGLEPASWEEALDLLAARISSLNGQKDSGLAALASTRLTAEALYAFKDLFANRLHSSRVSSIEESQTSDRQLQAAPGSLDALKESDCVVVLGADLVKGHQVAGFFVKRNLAKGARLVLIDPHPNGMEDFASFVLHPQRGTDRDLLEGLISGIVNLGLDKGEMPLEFNPGRASLAQASQVSGVPVETIVAVSRLIGSAQKPVFVYGKGLTHKGSARALQALHSLAQVIGEATLVHVKGKANSFAAQRYRLDKAFNSKGCQLLYLALGDDEPTSRLAEYVSGVPFLAVQASFASPLTERADIVLPVETWAEQDGHYLNLEGRLQRAHAALVAPPAVRSNLDALQALAERLGLNIQDQWKEEIDA